MVHLAELTELRVIRVTLGVGFSMLALAAPPHEARAQATDIKVRKPDVLLLLDNSGSMTGTLSGSYDVDCGAGKKARWTTLAETLTGTVNNLACSSSVMMESTSKAGGKVGTGCRPYRNLNCDIRKALEQNTTGCGGGGPKAVSRFGWPLRNGLGHMDRGPLSFCGKNGKYSTCTDDKSWGSDLCQEKAGEWDQNSDGLLDAYAKTIRFGMTSFDSLETYSGGICQGAPADCGCTKDNDCFAKSGFSGAKLGPYSHACDEATGTCLPYLTATSPAKRGLLNNPANCQNLTDGGTWSGSTLTGCSDLYPIVWNGWQVQIAGNPQWSYWYADSGGANTWLTGLRTGLTVDVDTDFGPLPETNGDIGFRNPAAWPTRGRLIGFGPADYNVGKDSVLCSSEDQCTELHNTMVQQAILGESQYLDANTPLAAMMRDAYQFVKYDTKTKGVHLPHDMDIDPTADAALYSEIGPKADTYYTGATQCRTTSVVLVTDGEPYADLLSRMSDWAGKLYDEENVRTFVVGVGMDTAKWWSPATSSVVTSDCAGLRASDLGAGAMCERSGALTWRFADGPDAKHSGVTPSAIRACCNLLETAVEGSDGSGIPYFPKTQGELKSKLNEVLSNVAGGSVSRTVPIYAPPAVADNAVGDAAANGYELRSSMEVGAGDAIWRGHLERVRYTCDNSDEPVQGDIERDKGDRFDLNVEETASTPKRTFFTVVPRWSSGSYSSTVAYGSLRSAAANKVDGLIAGGEGGSFIRLSGDSGDDDDDKSKDDRVEIRSLYSAMKRPGAPLPEEVLGLSSSDDATCLSQTGDKTLGVCADRVLRWYGGDSDPDDGGAKATDPCPSRDPDSAQCKTGTCSPLGAVYRSSPAVVPPPSRSVSDDQNYASNRTDGSDSFVSQFGRRPTMVYAQTIDGMLHAFVLNKNEDDPLAPFGGSDIPAADELANNELWSFVPPAVLPRLWPSFNVHARLLDGQLTWSDVVYERPANDAGVSNWSYATVLVGASGATGIGGFYYALDVSDPSAPKFLWQLSRAGDESGVPTDALFGASVPGALITHIRFREKSAGPADDKLVAVAVLPGGTPKGVTPSKVRNRHKAPDAYWSGTSRTPRSKIRDWSELEPSGAVPSRSLTIVELKTGRILGRLVGEMADNPRNPAKPEDEKQTLLDASVLGDYDGSGDAENTPFDSPLSGIPVAFPASVGAVAQRIYVGDADGTLWRVRLDGPRPSDWIAEIAYDAYNTGLSGSATLEDAWVVSGASAGKELGLSPSDDKAALLGQPIQTQPTLSLDPAGNLVVVFATGDQESFSTYDPDTTNLLVSFPDVYGDPRKDGYQAVVNKDQGVEMAFQNGGRVTGQINIFDGKLFFAYFNPAKNLSCTNGTGGLCGVHYMDKDTGAPVGVVDLDGDNKDDTCIAFNDGSVVFGVSVNQVPSCAGDAQDFNDPWMAGKYSSVTQSKAGRFELSFHTGQGGSSPPQKGVTKIKKVALPVPALRVRRGDVASLME